MVASGSDDRTVKLWDVVHADLIHTFNDHAGSVTDVKYHPDGSCLASCSADKKIKIFDVRSQRLLQHYDAHTEGVNSVSFHSNGKYLVSTSDDSTVKIWDLRRGQIMYTLFGHEGPSTTATFSPLGDFLLTGGKDQNIVIWSTNLNEEITEELYGIQPARIDTDIYVTDKPEIKRLPAEDPKKKDKATASAKAGPSGISAKAVFTSNKKAEETEEKPQIMGGKEQTGPTYKMLRPEVKQTLDKLIYQLDLCRNTMVLLENRISINETRLGTVVDYIKNEDISYVSSIVLILSPETAHREGDSQSSQRDRLGSSRVERKAHGQSRHAQLDRAASAPRGKDALEGERRK